MLKLLYSRSLLVAALILAFALIFGPSAKAQDVPEARAMDENGVNLLTGNMEGSVNLVSIGNGSGALAHGMSVLGQGGFNQSSSGFVDIATTANNGLYDYKLSLPGSSAIRFTATVATPVNGTPFNEYITRGHSLSYANGNYELTSRDGALAIYSGLTKKLLSLTSADGSARTYHFNGVSLRSITNNSGYQLKYQAVGNESRVYAINNRIEYCDPVATSCTIGSQWAWGAGTNASVGNYKDAEGRITSVDQQFYSNTSIQIITDQASSTAKLYATYVNGRLTGGTRNGIYNGYVITDNDQGTTNEDDDTISTRVTYPDSSTRTVVARVKGGLILTDTNVLGQVTSYTYDSDNRVKSITYPRGDALHYTYDARGNVTQTRRSAGTGGGGPDMITSANYPATCTTANYKYCNKPTYTIDVAGNRTDYAYHAASGQVSQVQAPSGGQGRPTTNIVYQQYSAKVKNSAGNLINGTLIWKPSTVTSLAGQAQQVVTTYSYNTDLNLTVSSVQKTGGGITQTSTSTYDNFGNVIQSDGPLPGTVDVVTARYDKLRRTTGTIGGDPDGAGTMLRGATQTTYAISGAVSKVDTGTATGFGQSAFSSFNLIASQHNVLDNRGKKLATYSNANGVNYAHVDYGYDNRNRIECAAQRMNSALFNGTHTDGCTAKTAGAFGPDRITKRAFDVAGRVTATISAFGTSAASTVSANYYPYGPLKEIFDGEGNKTYYAYDGFNRSIRTYYPNTSGTGHNVADYEAYYYNSVGRRYNTRQRDGQTVTRTFDTIGRTTFVNAPGSTEDTTFTYDIAGNVLSVGKQGQSLGYLYDGLGRLTSETSSLGVVSYQYDDYDRRTRMDYPGAGGFYVTYDYLTGGEISAIKEKGTTTLASYTYDNLGRRKTVTRGTSANVTTYNYDAISRLTSLQTNLSGSSMDQTLSFSYTPSGQLAGQTNSNLVYDATITSFNLANIYNGLNQITSENGSGFTHDTAGNLLTGQGESYAYDFANRLTSVAGKGTLTYDPVSRLRTVSSGGSTTTFLYDGQDMIAEYNGTTVTKRYVHGAGTDEPLVEYTGSGTTNKVWLVPDVRGSIVSQASASGVSMATNRYDPYGQPQSTNTGRFQYTGQVWLAELDLYYYKARFYNPSMRRFLTTDPTGYGDGMNMYAYVSGDPVNMTDPSGLYGGGINGQVDEIIATAQRVQRHRPDFSVDWGAYFGGMNFGFGEGMRDRIAGMVLAQISDIEKMVRQKLRDIKEASCSPYDPSKITTDNYGDVGPVDTGKLGFGGGDFKGPFAELDGAVQGSLWGMDQSGDRARGVRIVANRNGFYGSTARGIDPVGGTGFPKPGIFSGAKTVTSMVGKRNNPPKIAGAATSPYILVSYDSGKQALEICY